MPVWTQQMTMHLNGGSKFSELHYKLLADGKETGITRHKLTNGSPKYIIEADEFHCGEEVFDNLKKRGLLMDWLNAHLPKPEDEAQGSAPHEEHRGPLP